MSAQDFESRATGQTAEEAFRNAREQATWEYGHRGYTGTIAEKDTFRMAVSRHTGETAEAYLRRLEAALGDETLAPLVRAVRQDDEEVGLRYLGVPRARPAPRDGREALAQDVATYEDKWGPALCIRGEGVDEWIFCGSASS